MSEQKPDDHDGADNLIEQFFSEMDEAQEVQQEADEVFAAIKEKLRTRGVMFPEDLPEIPDGDRMLREPQQRIADIGTHTQATIHSMIARTLTTAVLFQRKFPDVPFDEEWPLSKKSMQAHMIAAGLDSRWLDVADEELSGEPLDPDADADFIRKERRKYQEQQAAHDQLQASMSDLFLGLLGQSGEIVTLEDEELAVQLAGMYCLRAAARDFRLESWEADVRTVLMANGSEYTSRWRPIARFFELED